MKESKFKNWLIDGEQINIYSDFDFNFDWNREDILDFKKKISKMNLNILTKDNFTIIISIIKNNHWFKFNKNEIKELLKNCDMNKYKHNWTLFTHLLKKNEEIQFTKEELLLYWQQCSQENKERTFLNLVAFPIDEENKQKNFLLYDCYFQPTKKHLIEAKYRQSILDMIAKRDVFFQLKEKLEEKKFQENQKI